MSQAQSFRGIILDINTKLPVPYASVLHLKTSAGTISNQQGEFSIALKKTESLDIQISSIGYKTTVVKLSLTKDRSVIYLTSDETELKEVVIMPDNFLKGIISTAYAKISANYPQVSVELQGFYREVRKSEEKRYLYFGEAALRVQQKGYQHINEGAQVEVLKARITNFANSDSIDNVKYYNGPFIANWGDFVRTRAAFLNPSFFNKEYAYQLESITNYNNGADTVYVIGFNAKVSSNKKSGKLWISKKTFAYLKIEFENGNEYRQNLIVPVKFLSRKYQTTYVEEADGTHFLKYVSMTGKNFNIKTNKVSIPLMEFVTTNHHNSNDIMPIPVEKRLGYLSVFSMQANNYDDTFWDSYTSIEKDSLLKSQIKFHYSIQESKQINQPKLTTNTNTEILNRKGAKRTKLIQIIQRLHGGYGIVANVYQPVSRPFVELIYQKNRVANTDSKPVSQFLPSYTVYSGFDLNRRWSVQIRSVRNLLSKDYLTATQFLLNRSFLIKKMGNPIVLKAVFGVATIKTGFYLGEINSTEKIELNGQNLGYQTKAYLGTNNFDGVLGFELAHQKRRKNYFLTMQYNLTLRHQDALFFKTRKNIFFTRNAIVTDFSDEVSVNESNYKGVNPISLTLGFGF